MCLLLGFRLAATGVALFLPPALSLAQAGGLGGAGHGGVAGPGGAIHSSRPGIGVGRGYASAYGPIVAGGYFGSLSDEGVNHAYGGTNVITYNHYDQRRRDGGFYGGGGVFYGDDGYSRINAMRPHDHGGVIDTPPRAFASDREYRINPHIISLPDDRAAYGCPSEHESNRR